MTGRICARIDAPDLFIDHTAPLCSLLDIPWICYRPEDLLRFSGFYPGLRSILKGPSSSFIPKGYDTLLYPLDLRISLRHGITDPSVRIIYHLHGCSDKGYHAPIHNPHHHLHEKDRLLLYGKRSKTLFKDLGILKKKENYLLTGNYRFLHYRKYRSFYDALIRKDILDRFPKKGKIILYAPSWVDNESSSSFFHFHKEILGRLPSDYNMILKTHPFLHANFPGYRAEQFEEVIKTYEKKQNLLVLRHYPPVYPLLQACDIYLGDYSSVGYDALAFDKPLFFLNHLRRNGKDKGARLLQSGKSIEPEKMHRLYPIIFETLQEEDPFRKKRKRLYCEAFGTNPTENTLQRKWSSFLQEP